MAKRAGRDANVTVNSVAIEDELTTVTLNIPQEAIVVTSLGSSGPERVSGNYDWSLAGSGNADFAASQGDATLFAALGNTRALTFDPTGTTAGTNDPNYDGSGVLENYSITCAVGAPATYSMSFAGATALTRAVA